MLTLALAQALKSAGLLWNASKNDFFVIPDRGFDDQIFVINDMTVMVQTLAGSKEVTFHGSLEWALDHVEIAELIWLPREEQLREALEERLIGQREPALVLMSTADGYRCEIQVKDGFLAFEAFGACEVYGVTLLYLLENKG